jgi:hypothetical protein
MSTGKEDLASSNDSDSPEIAAYEALVQGLLDERKAIVARFKSQVDDLERDRNIKLELNRQRLVRIGYDQSKIPEPLGVGRKFLKLDDSRIKEVLTEFMNSGQWYPSTPLLQHLKISYPDFRDFVKKNADFIEKDGDNRGRLYKLKNRN